MDVELVVSELARRRAGRDLLLLLDFDGTLTTFSPDPGSVYLNDEVCSLLGSLAAFAVHRRRHPRFSGR